MKLPRFSLWIAVAVVVLVGGIVSPAAAQDAGGSKVPADYKKTAPLLTGLDGHHFKVSTEVPLAQRYFDQGLVLAFGFNHAESARSFREAQKLDPKCAMAYWGEALVLGPNMNAPMVADAVPQAWAALQKAKKHAAGATQREQDYIEALSTRYTEEVLDDRSQLDQQFADAMRKLADKYPDDYDAQALFAESLMDTTPWNYWLEGKKPKEVTKEILATLQRVLTRRPDHPLANHLYIHAVEAAHPEWAVACANRLGSLAPGAGHLVHMPSHIFIRVGRYADASDANEGAITVDDDYVTQCHAQGLYPLAYMPHNHHFLWFAAAMEGRAERSIEAARHISKHVDHELMRAPGLATLQHFYVMPLYALTRFGRWDEIMQIERPEADLKYPTGVWHFARGMALLRNDKPAEAKRELAALSKLAADDSLAQVKIWDNNNTQHILQVGEQVLAGEIAAAAGEYEKAVDHLKRAVELEDTMTYDEPQLWYAPSRQALGAVLLDCNRYGEAEETFRQDLAKYPDNGWSLFGLQQALSAAGKAEEAAKVRKQFNEAWSRADVRLTRAAF